jgi:hypothetical protein
MKTSTGDEHENMPCAKRDRSNATFETQASFPMARDIEAAAWSNLQDDPVIQHAYSSIRKLVEMIVTRWATGRARSRDRGRRA